jgi:drug/metabolite transporter (DMT)-like permease
VVRIEEHDSVASGAAWLLFGVTAGLGLDLCAKALLADYPLEQFVFLRSLAGLSIFLFGARYFGGLGGLATSRWPWHLLRTLLATGAMFGIFYGIATMPLVNALTLGFTAPLITTALAGPALGERVGWRRWSAVCAGFTGVLIMLRPGAGFPLLPSACVLASALCYAGLAITARRLGRTESAYSLSVYVIGGPLVVSGLLSLDGEWLAPDAAGWFKFLLAGACSVAAWIGIVNGYRRASPAALAPLEYTALVGAAAAGYFIWGEVPDARVVAGASVIIAAGIFVVYRDIGSARRAR